MSNIIPLGSGARRPVDPAAIPTIASTDTPTSAIIDTTVTAPIEAPAVADPDPATATAPFDISQFQAAFGQLKQQVQSRRDALTVDVGSLQAEQEQLAAQIADWDARAQAAEARQADIKTELDGKLTSFNELDQATAHLAATEALLYPQPAAPAAPTTA